jgi:hypothetical protein
VQSAPARCHPLTIRDFPLPPVPSSLTSHGPDGLGGSGGFSPCLMIMILDGGAGMCLFSNSGLSIYPPAKGQGAGLGRRPVSCYLLLEDKPRRDLHTAGFGAVRRIGIA